MVQVWIILTETNEIALTTMQNGKQKMRKNTILNTLLLACTVLSGCTKRGRDLDQELTGALLSFDKDRVQKVLATEIRDGDQHQAFDIISFLEACKSGDINKVKRYVDNGMDVNLKYGGLGKTVLQSACESGHKNIIELLLDRGANIEGISNNNKYDSAQFPWSPLAISCQWKHEEVALLLLKRGADIESKDNNGLTPLFHACRKGLKKVVNALIKRGANVNAQDNYGFTPLHLTTIGMLYSGEDSQQIINVLKSNGANTSIKDKEGRTYLDLLKQ